MQQQVEPLEDLYFKIFAMGMRIGQDLTLKTSNKVFTQDEIKEEFETVINFLKRAGK